MLLAYVDESGNVGPPANRGTAMYSLGCVLVDADLWPAIFEETLAAEGQIGDRAVAVVDHQVGDGAVGIA